MQDHSDASALLSMLGKGRSAPVCMLDFPRVGGATYYSLRRLDEYLAMDRSVLRLTCNADGSLEADLRFRDLRALFPLQGIEALAGPQMPRFHTILVNELATWTLNESMRAGYSPLGEGRPRWIPALTGLVADLAVAWRARLEYVLHDYFAVCPNFVLLDDAAQEHYCGAPGLERCSRCLEQPFMQRAFGPSFSMAGWRAAWGNFLSRARRVTCPSPASRDILARVYPSLQKRFVVIEHQPLAEPGPPLTLPGKERPMHVVVVGKLSLPKGAALVRRLALLLQERAPEASLTLVGSLDAPGLSLPDKVLITGPYRKEELGDLLRKLGASVGFIASVWPETFNYVTQELMLLKLPLVCFDLGAPAERIRAWEHGLVADEVSAEAALQALMTLDARRAFSAPPPAASNLPDAGF